MQLAMSSPPSPPPRKNGNRVTINHFNSRRIRRLLQIIIKNKYNYHFFNRHVHVVQVFE